MHKSEKAMRWGLRIHLFWYVVANVAQVVVWAIFTPDLFFWPLWSILGWGIGLLSHFWAVRSKTRSLVRS
ncbi:2TM domain-containing protein [Streptomyces sp. NPDC101234]|uniref:2TM domain-containing protein n=1 Tax=Streptomyces sp. NPDC101234 TaxID=3366138 RepID=UPI00381C9BA3